MSAAAGGLRRSTKTLTILNPKPLLYFASAHKLSPAATLHACSISFRISTSAALLPAKSRGTFRRTSFPSLPVVKRCPHHNTTPSQPDTDGRCALHRGCPAACMLWRSNTHSTLLVCAALQSVPCSPVFCRWPSIKRCYLTPVPWISRRLLTKGQRALALLRCVVAGLQLLLIINASSVLHRPICLCTSCRPGGG